MLAAPSVLVLALAPGARGADVDFFQPAGSMATGTGTLQAESPFLGTTGFSGGILVGMAEDPMVRRTDQGVRPVVHRLVPVHLQGSWTQAELLRVDVLLPVYAWIDAPMADFRGAATGDLRLQATVPLVDGSDALVIGLVPRVEVPTGSSSALVSGGITAGLSAAVGGRTGPLGYVANAGVHLASNQPLEPGAPGFGSRAQAVGGAWVHLSEALRVGAEADLTVGLAPGDGGANNSSMVHGFAQGLLPSGLGFAVGGGTGLLTGLGTPEYRVFGALTWTTLRPDRDLDGVVDDDDACPDAAEDRDAFEDTDGCPDPDNDADGVADASDRCPDSLEDADGFDDDDGCADPDNDGDGLVDVADQCPDLAGDEAALGCPDTDADGIVDAGDACPEQFGVAALRGCADTDGDGIADPDDRCPDQPRPASEPIESSDGCPRAVFVTDRVIEVAQRVEFETGRDRILASSHALLDQVARALVAAPHVRKVEVQGHTDNVGSAAYNRRLSQARARAVVRYLTGNGVDAGRLVAQGYGESTPLFTNRTESGREANRRVQFVVLDIADAQDETADADPR